MEFGEFMGKSQERVIDRVSPRQPCPECVEVAFLDGGPIGVRHSKNPAGPALISTLGEWNAFTAGVTAGEFGKPHA
jgi:hypothetical protein